MQIQRGRNYLTKTELAGQPDFDLLQYEATNVSIMRPTRLAPVDDPESAIGAGWFVEVNGRRVAELTEPTCVMSSQSWYSYVIVPVTNDPEEWEQLFSGKFWTSGKPVFRSRKFGVVATRALPSMTPPDPDTRRISIRGLNLRLDAGPGVIEMVARFFQSRKH
jgi:hypothetical protein